MSSSNPGPANPETVGVPGNSIWTAAEKETFYRHADGMKMANCVPKSWIHKKAEWPKDMDEELLPFATERQLADDFAFIAAYQNGVRQVTTATVEVSKQGVTVRLAANEGVDKCVQVALRELFRILESCARKGWVRDIAPSCQLANYSSKSHLDRNAHKKP
ncbi:hypothetical protein H2203_002658 [Taxawa tesnikishii (nom. ined.)]|nr:hypothetical protein H2203_002658 [Dothideales sp. JES 119]